MGCAPSNNKGAPTPSAPSKIKANSNALKTASNPVRKASTSPQISSPNGPNASSYQLRPSVEVEEAFHAVDTAKKGTITQVGTPRNNVSASTARRDASLPALGIGCGGPADWMRAPLRPDSHSATLFILSSPPPLGRGPFHPLDPVPPARPRSLVLWRWRSVPVFSGRSPGGNSN